VLAELTPQQAGLSAYGGNRRVPGLRREEVALLAGLSVDYYTRLERGNLKGASETALDALANAPQLDTAERAHLFDLARAANASGRTPRRPSPADRSQPSPRLGDRRWSVRQCSRWGQRRRGGVWSRHVGDPILKSNITRRVDFALFMVEALENDELVHEAPAIVGRKSASALAHAANQ